jgi:hypothetical protein
MICFCFSDHRFKENKKNEKETTETDRETLAAGNRDEDGKVLAHPTQVPLFCSGVKIPGTCNKRRNDGHKTNSISVMNITFFTLTQQHTRENFANLVTYSDG